MYKYKISIKKVSGILKESVLPKKNLVIKSKVKRTTRGILKEAAKYLLENYGLELRDAKIVLEGAPRLSSHNADEIESAEAAQTNHYINRPQSPQAWGGNTLGKIRDKVVKALSDSLYFRTAEGVDDYQLPFGIAIKMDGDVMCYGREEKDYYNKDTATGAGWKDQSYEADEKASDNVFTYEFDDNDFIELLTYKESLASEIEDSIECDDDEDNYYDDDSAKIYYKEELENMDSAMRFVEKYSDFEKQIGKVGWVASKEVFEEFMEIVKRIMKKYMVMNGNKTHSMMGMKKMEGQI